MDEKRTINSNGLNVLDGILILNIALKLLNKISWSWWIVLWPFWVQLILIIVFVIILLWRCK